jgi:heme/copper-type cytochrome/quinol oxidase subunit 2
MKTAMRGLIFVLLTVIGMALLEGNANAQKDMIEREHVQSIVWLFEFATFVTIIAIAWFVWRISKRDYKNRKSQQDNS